MPLLILSRRIYLKILAKFLWIVGKFVGLHFPRTLQIGKNGGENIISFSSVYWFSPGSYAFITFSMDRGS